MNEVPGVWQCGDDFEVSKRGESVEFSKMDDGTFYIGIDGYQRETFRMTAEQFEAFKKWVMDNDQLPQT